MLAVGSLFAAVARRRRPPCHGLGRARGWGRRGEAAHGADTNRLLGPASHNFAKAVAEATLGDFLVRKSRGSDMFVLVINDLKKASSFPITLCDNGVDYEFAHAVFPSLRSLIEYLRQNPLKSRVRAVRDRFILSG